MNIKIEEEREIITSYDNWKVMESDVAYAILTGSRELHFESVYGFEYDFGYGGKLFNQYLSLIW